MKILLTGATGFIGSHVLQKLIADNHEVTILIRPNSNPERIKGSLDLVEQIFESQLPQYFKVDAPKAILHFATHYVKSHTSEDVSRMISGNIQLPSLLLELAQQSGTTYFINIGTCFEYYQSRLPLTEESLTKPYNLYASTKLAFEEVLKFYTQQKIRAITLRLFYPYGEADNNKVIPLMVKSLLSNKKLVISKGEQYLDFTYVSDIVDATQKALYFISSDQYKQYEVFNIGEGKAKQLKDIATYLNQLHGQELIVCDKSYAENEIMNMVADVSKAKRLLDWQPQTSIEKGLKKVYQYYKKAYEQSHY